MRKSFKIEQFSGVMVAQNATVTLFLLHFTKCSDLR